LNKINPDYTAEHTKKKSAGKQVEKLRELQYFLRWEALPADLPAGPGCRRRRQGRNHQSRPRLDEPAARARPWVQSAHQHDFLWRIEQQAPKKGEVVIFNRSQYEDVLVVRVHKLVPKEVWKGRYELINDFEKNFFENRTHILKFFLHISPEEQFPRFRQRLDDPARHWKIKTTMRSANCGTITSPPTKRPFARRASSTRP
jgi:Polyphosphate kinase 2 (PPK2)